MKRGEAGIKGAHEVKFKHRIEYAGLRLMLALFRALGLDRASAFGSFLGKTIGPLTPAHRTALANLALCLPDKTSAEIRQITRDMWENLGRTISEYAHLDKLVPYGTNSRTSVEGLEHLDAAMASGRSVIFFSGHFANWEMMSASISGRGHHLNGVYRAANNPLVNSWMENLRKHYLFPEKIAKGSLGARQLITAVKRGEAIAMLVDQKMNDGIEVPFFGQPARTAAAAAQFAVKYNCLLMPLCVERTKGAHFVVRFYAPLDCPETQDKQNDIIAIATAYNAFLEQRIRAAPGQWLWMHNRWSIKPKKKKPKKKS